MSIRYAKELADVMRALDPKQLHLDELPDFFEETEEARDPHSPRREELADCLQDKDNVKVLVIGHAGTGKSTELVKFQSEHNDQYAFIVASPVDEMIMSALSIESILILIIESVARGTKKQHDVDLSDKTLQAIYEWFAEAFQIKEDDLKYGLEAGVGADTEKTWWGKLVGVGAYLKADIRTGSHTLNKIITKENKRISELAYQCNLLIRESKLAVLQKTGKELVLIIEDLDKITLQVANDIFIHNPAPLADLDCKAIYTLPIWVLCNPRSNILDPLFRKVTIPMIKICHQDMTECVEGCQVLKKIVYRRMDHGLIEDAALELAIKKTGGVVRHLFEVIRTAASAAKHAVKKGRPRPAIISEDIKYGLDQKKNDLVRSIGTIGLPEEYQDIKIKDMLDRLRELDHKPRKLESDLINMLLIQAHAVIEYNGEGWHCVHPLIAEHLHVL